MKLLLDTRTLLWVLGDSNRLRSGTCDALSDAANAVFVSVVSLWEIVVKRRVGKLQADVASIAAQMAPASKMQWLGIMPLHLLALDELPFHEQHRDPFDHLIIAQAISEGMTLVTKDSNAGRYAVQILPA